MKAADVMSAPVLSVLPDAPVVTAIRLMLSNRMSGLPVVDTAGHLVGIVSEGDLLRRAETGTERRRPDWLELLLGPGRLAEDYVRTHGRKVSDVMTAPVVSVTPGTELREIVELMEKKHIKRIPVVENGRLVGIVTRRSLLQGFAALSTASQPAVGGDTTLRDRIMAEIRALPWTPQASLNVVVHDGVAHLWGVILDERQRRALCLAAENVRGIRQVHDHLVWVEPMTGFSMSSPEDSAQARSRQGLKAS